jgi:hypothetical protein
VNERRKTLRRGLHLPVVVKGHDHRGPWEERATSMDVSHGGISLNLHHPVPKGQVLFLTVPLPEMFRRHDYKAQAYNVYGLIRYVAADGPPYRLGVMFLGKHPPRGYLENPSGLVYLPTDPEEAAENRAHPRYPVMVTMRLRRLGTPAGPAEELTITEDVSVGGARVRTSLDVAKAELVFLTEVDGPFRAQAMVLNIVRGADNITRLNLHFMQAEEAGAAARDLLRRQGITAE